MNLHDNIPRLCFKKKIIITCSFLDDKNNLLNLRPNFIICTAKTLGDSNTAFNNLKLLLALVLLLDEAVEKKRKCYL